jgi:NHL repeat
MAGNCRIQTSAGLFSSDGGWNSGNPNRLQVTVQNPQALLSTINVRKPTDIKWMAPSNIYVLWSPSGTAATLTEYDINSNTIHSVNLGNGSQPSGLDVDGAGNVYVALTASNQVWKYFPTNTAFVADTNFGVGGCIGNTDGTSGTSNGAFNAPFDVAVSPDGGTISVSDSGNNRIQQFSTKGTFTAAFGTNGTDVGQFNKPLGLTYDSVGNLYIVDSGNNRIAIANDSTVLGVSGSSGTNFGQFSSPTNISVNERGIYVADSGNKRIQCFNPLADGAYTFTNTDLRFVLSTNYGPASVSARDDLTNELFYVADNAGGHVRLYQMTPDSPLPVWNSMTNQIAAGDVVGAVLNFSVASADDYRNMFLAAGTNNTVSAISQMGTLTPVYIQDDEAEYYFINIINGQAIMFPVKFDKENGVWKILEF